MIGDGYRNFKKTFLKVILWSIFVQNLGEYSIVLHESGSFLKAYGEMLTGLGGSFLCFAFIYMFMSILEALLTGKISEV